MRKPTTREIELGGEFMQPASQISNESMKEIMENGYLANALAIKYPEQYRAFRAESEARRRTGWPLVTSAPDSTKGTISWETVRQRTEEQIRRLEST